MNSQASSVLRRKAEAMGFPPIPVGTLKAILVEFRDVFKENRYWFEEDDKLSGFRNCEQIRNSLRRAILELKPELEKESPFDFNTPT